MDTIDYTHLPVEFLQKRGWFLEQFTEALEQGNYDVAQQLLDDYAQFLATLQNQVASLHNVMDHIEEDIEQPEERQQAVQMLNDNESLLQNYDLVSYYVNQDVSTVLPKLESFIENPQQQQAAIIAGLLYDTEDEENEDDDEEENEAIPPTEYLDALRNSNQDYLANFGVYSSTQAAAQNAEREFAFQRLKQRVDQAMQNAQPGQAVWIVPPQ